MRTPIAQTGSERLLRQQNAFDVDVIKLTHNLPVPAWASSALCRGSLIVFAQVDASRRSTHAAMADSARKTRHQNMGIDYATGYLVLKFYAFVLTIYRLSEDYLLAIYFLV